MTFDSKKIEFSKQHIYIVELELDFCSLTHGLAPCTATETGDAKCFNTIESSNDLPNYTKTTKIYRFCEPRSPQPKGLDAIPSVSSVRISPTIVNVKGGLSVRSNVSVNFMDHPHSDIGIDKYLADRSWIAFERGTFWTKLRARNPNYQFRDMRVLSGYLNDDGSYDVANFKTRHYVIDSMNVSGGQATVVGKDPLKLVASNKAQAPAASTGLLSAAMTIGATSLTLTPAAVGNAEYAASGFVTIKDEVMSFTRVADVLTVVRGAKNTVAVAHSQNDTVQQGLDYSGATRGQLDFIVDDLLTNFALIGSAFIPTATWDAEVNTYLSGLLDRFIPKPIDVNKLLIELTEAMPHYLWWDELSQTIQLTALKAPPSSANVLNMDGHLIAGSFDVNDEVDSRVSTVFVNFGQFNPVKKVDDIDNYQQTYIRIDANSVSKYGSSQIKVINSPWISNTNKAAALQLAALIGRRFSNVPRNINFSLDAKDESVWIGQSRAINHDDITDFSGVAVDTIFQIISARESRNYDYTALEYVYGDSLPEDEGGGDPDVDLVLISIDSKNYNMRTEYDLLFPAPDASTVVKFIVENAVCVGSTSTSASLDTGSWPVGATVTLQLNSGGFVVGKGGDGGAGGGAGGAGGLALILNHDLTLVNNGVIGGGGGGGDSDVDVAALAGGGGGAGDVVGTGGDSSASGSNPSSTDGVDGTLESGGAAGFAENDDDSALAFDGGDLGAAGLGTSGGAAGDAIDKNGNTLTETTTGDIRGSIIV